MEKEDHKEDPSKEEEEPIEKEEPSNGAKQPLEEEGPKEDLTEERLGFTQEKILV